MWYYSGWNGLCLKLDMSMTLIRPIQTEIVFIVISLLSKDELYIYNCVIDERLKFDHEIDKIDIHIIKMLIWFKKQFQWT